LHLRVQLVGLLIGALGGLVHATDWTLVPVAARGNTHPDIDGYRVAWTYGGSIGVYDHLTGEQISIPDSWGARNWLVHISGDRVAWIRHTNSHLMVYDLDNRELTHSIDVGSAKLFGLSGENALLHEGAATVAGDLYLLNLRTQQSRHIGKGGRTPTGNAPRADIDGDQVVYVLDGRCGHLTPGHCTGEFQ
jgi:hypothetical protein